MPSPPSNSLDPPGLDPGTWDSPGKNTGVGCHFLLQCMKVKSESEVAQSCQTPSDPMDCNPPGPFVPGIFQAWVLEWVAIANLQFTANKWQSQILNIRSLPPESKHALNHHALHALQMSLFPPIITYFTSNIFQTKFSMQLLVTSVLQSKSNFCFEIATNCQERFQR